MSAPAPVAAVLDLAFQAVFFLVVAREIATGRNWRNLPMVVALALLLVGNLLTHLDAMNIAATGVLGRAWASRRWRCSWRSSVGALRPASPATGWSKPCPAASNRPLSAHSTASRSRRRSWRSSPGSRSFQTRYCAPFTGEYYFAALAVAAGLWSLAYGLFVLLYFGMQTGPRARGPIRKASGSLTLLIFLNGLASTRSVRTI